MAHGKSFIRRWSQVDGMSGTNPNEPEERPKLGNIKISLNPLQKAEFETLLKIFLLKMQECFL